MKLHGKLYTYHCKFPRSLQVLTLRLLRAVLPSWEAGYNRAQQERLVDKLFSLLGEVLVICSSPFVKPLKPGQFKKHGNQQHESNSLVLGIHFVTLGGLAECKAIELYPFGCAQCHVYIFVPISLSTCMHMYVHVYTHLSSCFFKVDVQRSSNYMHLRLPRKVAQSPKRSLSCFVDSTHFLSGTPSSTTTSVAASRPSPP